jgi:hypothetical protein
MKKKGHITSIEVVQHEQFHELVESEHNGEFFEEKYL